jgi:DNA repair protein RecN (Recombination protein N)
VISGETGSGKSIVLQAIQFLLGEKLKSSPLRAGTEQGEVQGLFSLEGLPESVCQDLPDMARGEELSVVRSISRSGKGKVFINGRLASVALLEEVVGKIVNICGQNHHVRLLDQRYHLEVLDGFADNVERVKEYRALFEQWRERSRTLLEAEKTFSERESREAAIRDAVQELEAARLSPGIRAELEGKVRALSNAESLISASQSVLSALQDEAGPSSQLLRLQQSALEIKKLDPAMAPLVDSLGLLRSGLKDFEFGVQAYVSRLSLDDESLGALRDQLAEVARLERKYRRSDAELVQLLEEHRQALATMAGSGALQGLRSEVLELETKLKAGAGKISKVRTLAAEKLSSVIVKGLADVAMAGSAFRVALQPTSLGPTGEDRAEFLLSPNRGEPPKPLREIASGGELSRILLVLKQALSDRTGVNVLVFDEVDSGVSGAVARAVGLKLRALAKASQVICVTHLPQVASLADQHFLVGKHVVKEQSGAKGGAASRKRTTDKDMPLERTVTLVGEIEGDQRVDEIARMLAGYTVTAAARESARELLSSKD